MPDRVKSSNSYQALVLIVVAALVGGGVSVFSKIALEEIPPLSFTFLRFVLAALTLLPFLLKSKGLRVKNLKGVVLISLLATANVIFFIFGVGRTTATIAQTLYAGVPLMAGLLSFFLLKEKMYPNKLLGISFGFIGVLMIVLLPVLGQRVVFNGDLVGNVFIFVGVGTFALYSVLSKRLQKEYSPLELTIFFVFTTISVQLLLLPIDLHQNSNWFVDISQRAVLSTLYVGILGTGIYYLVYQYAIKHATPIVASMILYLQPVFSFAWASILLKERITPEFIAGAILAFIGVGLVTGVGKQNLQEGN